MKKLILIAVCALVTYSASAQEMTSTTPSEKQLNTNTTEIITRKTARVNIYSASNFPAYAEIVKEEIEDNDRRVANYKADLIFQKEKAEGNKKPEISIKKQLKVITRLEISNNELKADLEEYINYGIGDWKLFQREFNEYLVELRGELNDLHHDVADVIAQNK